MRGETNELKMNVEKFFLLLQNYPDDFDSTSVFVRFLRSFLRINVQERVLPTIEVITLIKEQKPNIFRSIRKLSEEDNMLAFLTGLSMDSQEAESRLQSIYEGRRGER
ncbi:hypothetical protein [Domibacillus aminovorans]|uniref:Uncharacterized protein n=1 Tax=Domibacillus aminovorans TaxID=29332 RepID=A0A177LA51_9BACI|nr:hypothetical protein [Domibacillus aminovorans]OAH61521.1 hypothetical protein AWH49_12200 [Domibacillus aminovorans]